MANRNDKIEKSRFLPDKHKDDYWKRLKKVEESQKEIAKEIKKSNEKIDLSDYVKNFSWNQ